MTDQALPVNGAPETGIISESGTEIHDRLMSGLMPSDTETDPEPQQDAPPAEPEPTASEPSAEEKVPAGVQRRIDELTWKFHESERRREAREAELAELLRRQKAPETPVKDPNAAPAPEDFPGGEYDPNYIRAMARYEGQQTARQLFDQYRQQEAEAQRQRVMAAREQAFAKDVPDYQATLSAATPVLRQLHPLVAQSFTESEAGPEMAYVLAKSPSALVELVQLASHSPAQALMVLGRLEDRLRAKPAAPEKPPEPPKEPEVVTTPQPWKGNGGGNPGTALERAERLLESTGDATDFIQARRKARK